MQSEVASDIVFANNARQQQQPQQPGAGNNNPEGMEPSPGGEGNVPPQDVMSVGQHEARQRSQITQNYLLFSAATQPDVIRAYQKDQYLVRTLSDQIVDVYKRIVGKQLN